MRHPRHDVRCLANWPAALALLCAGVCLCTTGCQVDVGGQTLPSPYYLTDDIQYFPAGPEFQLTNEVAAMERYAADIGGDTYGAGSENISFGPGGGGSGFAPGGAIGGAGPGAAGLPPAGAPNVPPIGP